MEKLAYTIDVGWAKGQNTREGESDRNSTKVTPVGCTACSDVVEWLADWWVAGLDASKPYPACRSLPLGVTETSGLGRPFWRPGFIAGTQYHQPLMTLLKVRWSVSAC